MTAQITFYPLGNADSTLIRCADDRLMLVDYANMKSSDDKKDNRCDLPKELQQALSNAKQDDFQVVCITHLDKDHVKGFKDFFELKYLKESQGKGRPGITELWVPAAAIIETGVKDDAWAVRQEARHRLIKGQGIKVFSRPSVLKDFLKEHDLSVKDREHCIVDAGKYVPGYSAGDDEGVEFFVHCPFAWRIDEREVEDRNQDSIVFQATFNEGGQLTYALFGSDVDSETLDKIVRTTKRKSNSNRLRWDILKLFHHCSYKSLNADEEEREKKDKVLPIPNVKWLIEDQGEEECNIISPSWPIPSKGSDEDRDKQPPHRQAASYYKDVIRGKDGEFVVTMEYPNKINPKPFTLEITRFGVKEVIPVVSAVGTATSTETRGG